MGEGASDRDHPPWRGALTLRFYGRTEKGYVMGWDIIEADCVEAMAAMDEASVDAVVCDPPYGLEFMGKEWDRLLSAPSGSPHARQHSVSFVNPGNPTCRNCGGLKSLESEGSGGRTKCRCERPDFPNHLLPRARAMQEWHEAWAREALRVLKPGGHLLAFGGTRTYHRLACAIEDAGFEIRDTIAWMYGSGFPKSLDVGKAIDAAAGAKRDVLGDGPFAARRPNGSQGTVSYNSAEDGSMAERGHTITAPATPDAERWQGWGTALKPAHEPIVVARKPLSGTVAATVLEHGTGALNIDATRIGTDDRWEASGVQSAPSTTLAGGVDGSLNVSVSETHPAGRWPANVVLDPEAAAMLDEQTGTLHGSGSGTAYEHIRNTVPPSIAADCGYGHKSVTVTRFGDSGGASRFFYVGKASSSERSAGLPNGDRSTHPTVKPVALMRWLVRLVTPPDGLVIDPFAGSGTTGIAAILEGFRFVGIEREPEYAAIARARVEWWSRHPDGMELVDRLEAEKARKAVAESGQLGMFDA